jgi:hypothetical protein
MIFIIQKIADEGSSEPYYARLWIGIFELLDQAIQFADGDGIELRRTQFDELYHPVLEATGACREACQKILASINEHQHKLQEVVKRQPHALEIPESVQKILANNIRSFLVNGAISIKRCQDVVRLFGIDIGCLFTKQHNFEKGIGAIRTAGHNKLADFLIETRTKWSETLIKRRDELEHNGWTLPNCNYKIAANNTVDLIEPEVDGEPISAYIQRMLNRITSFVENCIIYSIQSSLPNFIVVVEIPRSERDADKPMRFRVSLRGSNEKEWEIIYSETDFP